MRLFTSAAARLFRLGTDARRWGYARGLFRTRSLSHPVISVGNLSVGGTGKSPMVAYLAGLTRELGFEPAILTRGYRGKAESGNLLVSDGSQVLADSIEAGDEAYMLASTLPTTPVGVGANRWETGRLVEERLPHPRRLFLLDDGFQHLRLARDLDLVAIDATLPPTSDELLPLGRLREPLESLRRADAALLTRCHLATKQLPLLEAEIQSVIPGLPLFRFRTVLVEGVWVPEEKAVSLEETARRKAVALAAIGNPSQFLGDLGRSGLRVINEFLFRDHHPFTQAEIDQILDRSRRLNADLLVTTEKDSVRLRNLDLRGFPTLVIRIRFEPEDGDAFKTWLATRLPLRET